MTAKLVRSVTQILTDAGGNFTTETDALYGAVYQYRYVPDTTNPLATGADLTIVGRDTGVSIANLTDIGTSAFTRSPRQLTHAPDGTASSAAEGLIVIDEPLVITVAQGGNADAGTLYIWIAI